jgi:hypothetical protein
MSWGEPILEGDLVMWRSLQPEWAPLHIKKCAGKIGIVTARRPRWPDNSREDEMIITVFYPDLCIEEEWSNIDLELINESR